MSCEINLHSLRSYNSTSFLKYILIMETLKFLSQRPSLGPPNIQKILNAFKAAHYIRKDMSRLKLTSFSSILSKI